MNYVSVDNLPRYKDKGYNQGKIDWSSSIGIDVEFQYENIHGYFHLIEYKKEKNEIVFTYNNEIYSRTTDNFKKCKLKNIFDSRENKYIYKVGDIFDTKTGQIQIIEIVRHKGCKAYKYKCLVDGYIGVHTEYDLKYGRGCSVCNGSVVCVGINDLWTTHPDIAKLLKDPSLGYQYSSGSHFKAEWICPDCENTIKRAVKTIVQNGIRCNKCSDGFPYGEKFINSLLSQLQINFYHRHTFEWSQNKEYDFFIPSISCVIEVHGMQHYKDGCFSCAKSEIKYIDVHNNDVKKKNLALDNGIKHYIIIDVRYSSFNWIKHSILNSDLAFIYNLNNINWDLCQTNAVKSYVKIVCDLWNKNPSYSVKDISEIVHKAKTTVNHWLKQGQELGWCNYIDNYRNNYRLYIEYNGINKTIKEWSSLLDMSYGSIQNRFRFYKYSNEDPEKILVGQNKDKLELLHKITNELKS